MKKLVLLVLLVIGSVPAHAQGFTCPIGKRAACLDYSDNICDGFRGKCVQKDAQCFDSYTCFPGGFVCKEKLDDLVNEYDALVSKHNSLVRSVNDMRSCIQNASSTDEAQACVN